MGREIIRSDQELELPGLQVYRNRIPTHAHRTLAAYILGQPNRKIVHPLHDPEYELPRAIANALPFIPLATTNTLITKLYVPGVHSEAFVPHRDPPQFRNGPQIHCTIEGTARFWLEDFEIHLRPNTIVVDHEDSEHWVSPSDGMRAYMFGGTDSTCNSAASTNNA